MKILVAADSIKTTSADTVVVLRPLGDTLDDLKDLNDASQGAIGRLYGSGDFAGEVETAAVVYLGESTAASRAILVGLGDDSELTPEVLRRAAAFGAQRARDLKAKEIAIVADGLSIEDGAYGQAAVEGALMGLYQYFGQKTAPNAHPVSSITLLTSADRLDAVSLGATRGQTLADGANLTRDLVNLPPNICTPSYLASRAVDVANKTSLQVEILEEKQMQALKMGALLGVAQGSHERPRFVVMQHNADKAETMETVVLIGKGVTFDTGGYSLKTRDGMIGMKADMGGGAAVIGAMQIIAQLNLPLHVVGLVPTSDNNVSDKAYRPQEVLTASNGKTIEVISTDAEGRLLLADALVYAKRFDPAAVVDIATLTGSCVVALGHAAAGLFYTTDKVRDLMRQAGHLTSERVWPLPIYPAYHKAIRSETADVKNSGGRMNGVGTSAAFLQTFVDFPTWAHVDMAGMVQDLEGDPTIPAKGASGYGARLLSQFVELWSKSEDA